MADTQLLEIIVIATIAAVVLFRLYTVLGRRTGNETPPQNYRVPRSEPDDAQIVEAPRQITSRTAMRPSDPLSNGLFDISLADKSFDKDKFLSGARGAYEMIEEAFARGDRGALRPLLGPEVFTAFEAAITAREQAGQKCRFTFVDFKEVKIVGAVLKGHDAEITVSFKTEVIQSVVDASGTVVSGDEQGVTEINDIWTFSRDVLARNPNWILVTTAAEA